jgi:hypothetical protein
MKGRLLNQRMLNITAEHFNSPRRAKRHVNMIQE